MDEVGDDPRLGTTLDGRYRLTERIAQGSMGVVYRGERVKIGRLVAVKFLHGLYADDPMFVQRFEREVRVMSKIAHPHCVSIIDLGMADAPYVVMEYVTGRTLRVVIDDEGRLAIPRAIHIGRQMLAGLAHAHAHGVVHRDIKPANVMLTEATGTGDHVRILDFGLATLVGTPAGDLSQSQVVVGTPSYMAPEQSLGDKVDGRADIYSTACVLFELLTGQKPFRSDSTFDLIRQHREQAPPRLREVAPEIEFPLRLERVLAKALAKRPEDRFASAIDFSAALGEAIEPQADSSVPEELVISETRASAEMPVATPRGRGGAWLAALVALLVGGGVAAWRLGLEDLRPRRATGQPSPAAPGGATAASKVSGAAPGADEVGAPLVASAPVAAIAGDGGTATGQGAVGPDGGPAAFGAFIEGGDAGAGDAPAAGEDAELDFAAEIADEDPDRDAGAEAPLPAEEEVEPVAPLPATAETADRAEPTTLAELEKRPAPPRTPDRADTLDEALALIKAGRRDDAIDALRRVRQTAKKSPYVPYLLGNLYFEKRWFTVGMEHYAEAIAKNRAYRRRATLNRNLVRALADSRTQRLASSILQRKVGRSALPFLDKAARSDPNKVVKRRAAAVARAIRRKR